MTRYEIKDGYLHIWLPMASLPVKKSQIKKCIGDLLTPREKQVLKLVQQGKCNKEIAQALSIAERTAKAHMSSIFDKVGVRKRAAVAEISYEAPVLEKVVVA